ncbi:hypothetical protein [Nonomuraea sp. NPDC003709]|uniref:hypothetical protein n=1 Tax=Nonomuraea sp. NPDC003709 TaxID=3154450 RepID=UPI0033B5F380
MRPRLKGISWERVGDELRLVYDPRDQLDRLLRPVGGRTTRVEQLGGGPVETAIGEPVHVANAVRAVVYAALMNVWNPRCLRSGVLGPASARSRAITDL